MDSIERRVRNAIASTEAEGIKLSAEHVQAMHKIARGELDAADHIRRIGLIPREDIRP